MNNTFVCFECKKTVHEEDAVFINPSDGRVETENGEAYHVGCAPEEVLCSNCSDNSCIETCPHCKAWFCAMHEGHRCL